MSVEFPQILYDIRDDPDNNFTVVVGTTCQKLTLYNKKSLHAPFFRDTAVKTIGVIIANQSCSGLEYDQSDFLFKLDSCKTLFEILGV